MVLKREYRGNWKGGGQGYYVIAKDQNEAIAKLVKNNTPHWAKKDPKDWKVKFWRNVNW